MACPICNRRRAKRFCPAKAENICTVCCGSEREVTIDCPSDCPFLVASREYDYERKEIDWAKLPFPDTKITTSFLQEHKQLVDALAYAICAYASQNRLLVDSDVLASFESLATAYRTLASGIYYEKPPDYRVQRELYEAVKAAIESYKKEAVQGMGVISVRDGDIRDALIFFIHLGFARSNGRSKGRAYLDFLRTQFKSEAFSRPASNIVLLP